MIHYNFHPVTRIALGPAPSDLDPLESALKGEPVYAKPGHSTFKVAPVAPAGEVAVFDEELDDWLIRPNVLGIWYGANRQFVEVDDLQTDVSELTRQEPPSVFHDLMNGVWILNTERQEAAALESRMSVVVSRFQARAALHLAGLLLAVELVMTSPDTDMLTKLAWQDAQEFKRSSPTVASIAAALGLTDQQLDDLFATAAGIEA